MTDKEYLHKLVMGIGLTVFLVLAFVHMTIDRRARFENGFCILAYGIAVKVTVGILWLVFFFFLWVFFIDKADELKTATDFLTVTAFLLGFLALVLVLHLELFLVRVQFDEKGIQTRSPWRRSRQIPWSDVLQVWYSPTAGQNIIETKSQGRIRLQFFLGGIAKLYEELAERGVPGARL